MTDGELQNLAERVLGITAHLPDETPVKLNLDAGQLRAALRGAFEQGQASNPQLSPRARQESLYFRQLMNSLPDFVYFKDRESRFVVINQAHAGNLGLSSPEQAVGKSDFDFFSKEDAAMKLNDERLIIQTRKGYPPKVEHNHHHGGAERWALSTKHPLFDRDGEVCGIFGLSRDVTAEYKAKQDLAEQHRLLDTLINVLPCRIFIRDREHRFRLINQEYRRSLNIVSKSDIIGRRIDEFIENQPQRIDRVLAEDESIMADGHSVLRRVEFDTSPLEEGRWLSVSKVPLRTADGTIEGLVGVSFDITAQKEAEARAKAFGKALQRRNQQMESELALARKLQTTLATFRFPSEIGLGPYGQMEAAYLYEPSEHLAGDFFHILPIDDRRVGAFICDVMGHGVRSALVTAVVRGLLEEKRAQFVKPAQVFTEINDVLHRLGEDPDFPRFVTATFVLFDFERQALEIVCAGHPPVLGLARSEGEVNAHELAHARDPALGLVAGYPYEATHVPLGEDRLFLLYTDGILEERDSGDCEFGLEGVEGCMEDLPAPSAQGLIQLLRQRLENHSGKTSFADDVCAVAISLRPAEPPQG